MRGTVTSRSGSVKWGSAALLILSGAFASAQDPAEPPSGKSSPPVQAPPSGAIARSAVDEEAMRSTIDELVACGTRHSLSSWDDAQRAIASPGDSALKGISTDNHFFAVRSVGKNGARSIPVAAKLKPPQPKPIPKS